ncbi:MAG TPA: TetR/AcrR family transcriptional regulator [Micrococcaceae bacterium]
MTPPDSSPSARKVELLDRSYRYVLDHGLADLSLRPLAAAIGSSPRVLIFLFASKDGLVRALLNRARADELALLERLPAPGAEDPAGLQVAAEQVWSWLSRADHRPLLMLWLEAYARSLVNPGGVWSDFARATVQDWLAVLAEAQPPAERYSESGRARRTLMLAVLRGALLDLLATGDTERTTAAVRQHLDALGSR